MSKAREHTATEIALFNRVQSGELSVGAAAIELGISYEAFKARRRTWLKKCGLPIARARYLPAVPTAQAEEAAPTSEQVTLTDKGDTGDLDCRSFEIKTLDQLIESGRVDLSTWEVDKFVLNSWEVGVRADDGSIQKRTLYQVKAWLKRNRSAQAAREAVKALLEDLRKSAPVYPKVIYPRIDERHLLEIFIPDLHIGKLCWGQEVGEDYDIEIAKQRFMESITTLLTYARSFPVEKILLPLGNDFFNVDNGRNETTAGTRQDVDSRWQKSFIEGTRLLRESIDLCCATAPVSVVMVPGNHDAERVFYAGEVLAAYYANCPSVTIDNRPKVRKYFRYGNGLIGFTHGNREKPAQLPMLMAQEAARDWAETRFREWHRGHLHHEKAQEFTGVTVHTFRSLSPSDAWHYESGYESLRSAEAVIWHHDNGPVARFRHTP